MAITRMEMTVQSVQNTARDALALPIVRNARPDGMAPTVKMNAQKAARSRNVIKNWELAWKDA